MRSRTMNMSTGRPLALLAVFALPLLIGNLFQQAYNLADSIIVGRLVGADALAAVGATGSVSFLFFSVCNGISSGGGIITAQYFGSGNEDRVKKAIANSAYIMLFTSFLMSSIAFALVPVVLKWMGTPAEIYPSAVTYMRMTCLSVPLIGIYNYASSMLRALGDSRTPLVFLIVACLLNVCMDLLFVGVFKLGVFGAALATMLAQLLAGLGCLLLAIRTNPYFHLERKHLVPDRFILWQATRLGLPMAMQWSMIAVSTTALQRVVNSFGTAAIAAFTATSRIEQLVQQPYGSLGIALSTYSGQNLGAGKPERIRNGFRDSMIAMAVFSGLMLVIVQIFGGKIVSVFVTDRTVVSLGSLALRITSCFYLFLGIIYMTRGVLNGVGDVLFSFINGIVEMICRICLPIVLLSLTGAGVWSIWWTAGLTWMAASVFCLLRYWSWKKSHFQSAPGLSSAF